MGKICEQIYCAFCKIQRRAYTKRHIGATNVGLCFLVSVFLMFIVWQDFDARVFVIFVGCLTATEIFVQMRWRTSVACPYCGFDPVTYLNDRKLASETVKKTLETRRHSARAALSAKNPFLNLPIKVQEPKPLYQQELEKRLKSDDPVDQQLTQKLNDAIADGLNSGTSLEEKLGHSTDLQ